MRCNPAHEKRGGDKQEHTDRQGYAQGKEFHRTVGGLSILDQRKQARCHAQNDHHQHDGNDDFNQSTTRKLRLKEAIVPDSGLWLP